MDSKQNTIISSYTISRKSILNKTLLRFLLLIEKCVLRTINTGKVDILLLGRPRFLKFVIVIYYVLVTLVCLTSNFHGVRWYIECFWNLPLSGFEFMGL